MPYQHQRRRKRSGVAALSTAGAVAMLSGCDSGIDDAKLSAQQFGPPTEVAAFTTVGECVASGKFDQTACETAHKTALASDTKAAPKYASKQECETNFGDGACEQRGNGNNYGNGGGGSFFTPLLTGFMIGQLMNGGGGYRYSPLYRDRRDGRYYTGGGAWLSNNPGSRLGYNVGSRGFDAPVTTSRIQTRSSVVSRGGFGGRATSGGGWGGGRGFGA